QDLRLALLRPPARRCAMARLRGLSRLAIAMAIALTAIALVASAQARIGPAVRGRAAAAPRAEVVRGQYGVPHLFVKATGEPARIATAYAGGYAQAQDRLFQMDLFRRAAVGRLAELATVGASYLDMDIAARRDGSMPADRERDFQLLSREDQLVT